MPSLLTKKQEEFAQHFVTFGDATKAYRAVYNVREGTKEASVWRTAKELLDHPKISSRIAELRKPAADTVSLTLHSHLKTLEEMRQAALAAGNYSAAIQAEHHRGKAAGLYVDRSKSDLNISGEVPFIMNVQGKPHG